MGDAVRAEKVPLREVPQPYQGTLALWLCGESVREHVGVSKFYTHRRKLMEYGYDIGKRPPSAAREHVVRIVVE